MCFLVVDQSATPGGTTGTGRAKSRLVFDAWSALAEGPEVCETHLLRDVGATAVASIFSDAVTNR